MIKRAFLRCLPAVLVGAAVFVSSSEAEAQSEATQQVSVGVPPLAVLDGASAPVPLRQTSDGMSYASDVYVSANAPYRVSVERLDDGDVVWIRDAEGDMVQMQPGEAVTVAVGTKAGARLRHRVVYSVKAGGEIPTDLVYQIGLE